MKRYTTDFLKSSSPYQKLLTSPNINLAVVKAPQQEEDPFRQLVQKWLEACSANGFFLKR